MIDKKTIQLGFKILAYDLEAELRRSCADAISSYIPKFGIKRTGYLTRNIKVRVNGNKLIISMPDYGKYIEYGTGIFGPKKRPITPKNKKALAFGDFIFKSVKGRPSTPFIRPVFHAKLRGIVENAFKKAIEISKQ